MQTTSFPFPPLKKSHNCEGTNMQLSWTREWVHNCGNRPLLCREVAEPEPEVNGNRCHLVNPASCSHESALLVGGGLHGVPGPVGRTMPAEPVAWQGPAADRGGAGCGETKEATEDRAEVRVDKLGGGAALDAPTGEMEEIGLMADAGTCFSGGVSVRLQNMELWQSFSNVGTEMVINRTGRRMFPFLSLDIRGLQPNKRYSVGMRIVPVDNLRYKFTNLRWFPVTKAAPRGNHEVYLHPDSPNSAKHWLKKEVEFAEVKITNNKEGHVGHLVLQSMCKYTVEVVIVRLVESGLKQTDGEQLIFPLPLTTFMAVTAYQNEEMVKMKIRNNPFAKTFRANIAMDGAFYENAFSIPAIKQDLMALRTFREMGQDPTWFPPHAAVNYPLQSIGTNLQLPKMIHLPSHPCHKQLMAANYLFMLGGIPPPLSVQSSLGLPSFEQHKSHGNHSTHPITGTSRGLTARNLKHENAAPYPLLPSRHRLSSQLPHHDANRLVPTIPMYQSLPPFMFPSYDALASSSSSSSGSSGIGGVEYSGLAGPYMHRHLPPTVPCYVPFCQSEQQMSDRT